MVVKEEKFLELDIVTPVRAMVTDQVKQVNVPGDEGDFGILYDHAPLLTTLRPGRLSYEKNNEIVPLVVSGGYLEVADNRVIILADSAEFLHEIDRERAERGKLAAEKLLADLDLTDTEFKEAQLKLFRAIARLENSKKQ